MFNVLIVDDSKTILTLLKNKFSQCGNIHVFEAEDYKGAMAIIRRHHHDINVALLDVNLPDAPNGEVILLANAHKIPTIVLTGTLSKTVRENIQKKEIISYILKDKPSSIDLAVKTTQMLLNNSTLNILIVDDSKMERANLHSILKKINCTVLEAASGQEALDIFKENKQKISLVITDYMMPLMDGLELTIKLRETYDKDELAIIAISSNDEQDSIHDFLTFGANDFITKPFHATEVISRVNANLELLNLFTKIKDMANKDFLTGAYNRRYFFHSGNAIFAKAKRKNAPIAVAMIDIDKFKNINDTYGHDVGDIAIKEIKKILDKHLRTSDLVARFGGEEFCIILEDIDMQSTAQLFEKIRKSFEENVIRVNGLEIKYSVSFGVAYGLLNSLEEMVVLSDEALYNSKTNGRNQVSIKKI